MSTELDLGYGPDVQEIVDRAHGLVPLLRARAADGEADRGIARECADALREAGFFRMSVPKRFGGDELDIRSQVAAIAAIGRGDASAGWLVSITGAAETLSSLVSEEGAEEMFGATPDVYVCANGGHHGATATRGDGGYLVSGRFPTISGCEIGDWMILAVVPVVADGEPTGELISMAAPPRSGRIDRTWHVAGMRATGSHTVEYDSLFVPDRRVIEHEVTEAQGLTNFPSLETFAAVAHRSIASLVGAAHGALDTVRATLDKGKPLIDTTYAGALDSPLVRQWLGEATHLVDTAYRHMLTAADIYDAARARGDMSRQERTTARMHGTSALEAARQAMARILDLGGTGGFASANPLQRYWRDFEVGSHHIHFSKFVASEDYSRTLLGDPTPVSLIH
ncbi:acyl-CoA dehydrogenase family protein [Actinosynnema pretiosum subsp. pretiosum]|uniref:Acyl-CoA dehydrogenase family protein n=1 Tax=Actinosynnema pretiosum subsp. pretiosum TaxID=103721 RepID=A0AA45L7E2_9PSEU|nr:acyl-CoA dehydrogenase family protein [Actinosynnema mirum]AXX31815.1 putative indole oxygenase [Actinosynnema pretiosum subsp. pretiosum]QUF04195.1 acyl-CoA dehydrogenase family protein [Actinosynnema pretiosum subsp. pretiosum]